MRVLAALLLLMLPVAAHADPITLTAALIELGVSSAAAAALASAAAFLAANAVTIGVIGASIYGSVESRRRQRHAAADARAQYNAALQDRTVTTLRADPEWRIVYGRCIVGGDIVGIFTSDKTGYRENGTSYTKPDALKHLVVVVAAHQVQAINDVFIDGISVGTLDGNGWVTGGEFYTAGKPDTRSVQINAGGFLDVPEAVVTVLHAYYEQYDSPATVYIDVTPTLSLGNTRITNPNPDHQITVDYTIAHDSTAKAAVRVGKHLGTSTQTADTYLMGVVPSEWTSADRLRGLAYVVVTLDLEETRFQGGPPALTFDVSGRLVYDPRSGLTAWSDNPALIARDWITSAHGFNVPEAEVDDATVVTAANACDVAVTLTVGASSGSGYKWRASGAVTTGEASESVLDNICAAMAGYAYAGPKWIIMAGAWTAPVMSLGDDELDGQISVAQVGAGIDEAFNGLRTSFIPSGSAVVTEGDPYSNAAFVTADGRELWSDVVLPFVDNRARAKNVARILTERARESLVINYPAKMHAWPLQVGDRVSVTSAEYGWSAKTFRVTDWQFGVGAPVMLTLQEDAAAVWDMADAATSDQAPNTGLPNPWTVSALSGLTAVSNSTTTQVSGGSAIVPRVLVSWTAVTDAYVADGSGRIEILWRRPGGPWQQVNVPGDSTSVYIVGPNHGDRIVIEARARNGLGKVGPSVFVGHTVSGATTIDWSGVDGWQGDPGSFFEGFEASTALNRWTRYRGSGQMSLLSVSDAGSGGAVLRVGNNTGDDEAWLIHDANIPFDPSALYRVKARVRRLGGSGTTYVGLAGVAADGSTFVNSGGANSYVSQHYVAAAAENPPSGGGWAEYTGYVRGTAATGTTAERHDPSAPGVMHTNVRYIRPLVLVNYPSELGITEVDYISVERLGGTIGTGDLADGAATELLEDEWDFAGGAYGTATVRTVTFTPASSCTIEFTATLEGENIYPDSGNYAAWYYSTGGADVLIAACPSVSIAYFRHVLSKMFTATGGVTLTLKLKTQRNVSNPAISLWKSYMRLTAVKK